MTHFAFAFRRSPGGTLPEWASELAGACGQRYAFSTAQVHEGCSVLARRTGEGTGPLLVMTRSEEEMRAALGLKPRIPPP